MKTMKGKASSGGLTPYLNGLGIWSLALGSMVGWGAFVMPGTTFLPTAGPMGTMIGLLAGVVVLLVIAYNYHVLINLQPEAAGSYGFTRGAFNYDHGFLCAWFLILTYLSMSWANASALPLILRNLMGDAFQVLPLYQIGGYQVYLGEAAVSMTAVILGCLICIGPRKLVQRLQAGMALGLCLGVAVCFLGVCLHRSGPLTQAVGGSESFHAGALGVMNIVVLAPWAFVGFESVSHSSEEFRVSRRKTFGILAFAMLAAGVLYSLLTLMAAAAAPEGFSGWPEYIGALGTLSGLQALPTFFAAWSSLGSLGAVLMALAAFCAIFTSLVANTMAASRLVYALAKDRLLPESLAGLDGHNTPGCAVVLLMLLSLPFCLLGRSAIGWIVDVTTIGAAIVYAYVSVAALKLAQQEKNRPAILAGALGVVISAAFLLVYMIPNSQDVTLLSKESYLITAGWSILGFVYFWYIFRRDKDHRLGHSVIVWIVLLFLILITTVIWFGEATAAVTNETAEVNRTQLQETLSSQGVELPREVLDQAEGDISRSMERIRQTVRTGNLVQTGMIVVALFFLFSIYSILRRREKQMEVEKILAEESSRAKTSFLSNMSHEIRTPMNAIIGLDTIALKDPSLSPRTREQLEKIGGSAQHLLGLINDILDMSRIESGRMVLKAEDFSLRDFLDQVNVIINGQCQDKGLQYDCRIIGAMDDYFVGDDMKLKQVMINILGNAVKFTNPPGSVTFTAQQTAKFDDYCTLRFTMQDTGIGMDKEYLPKIFEAFSQEDATAANRYGGSGLGMAITKNIVEMMNGEIAVESEKGVGTTFTVTVTLKASHLSSRHEAIPLSDSLRVLVVDDDEVACEHAQLVLQEIGIRSERCTGSREALATVRAAHDARRPYQLVLTDYLMPDMNGIALTREIRRLGDSETAVILLTGYSFEDMSEDAMAAGADSLLSKPLFADTLRMEIQTVLDRRADRKAESQSPAEPEEPVPEGSLEGLHVLMAEDVDINADILADLLDMEGISSERAENGQIAVELFEKSAPGTYDAILMDMRMPVMDGLEAARTIRASAHPNAKTIPIIALTANAFDEDVQRSLQTGMNAHLSKPVDLEKLCQALLRLTRGAGTSEQE